MRVFELAASWLILLPLAPFGLFWLGVGFSLRYALSYYLVLRSRLRSAQQTRRHLANTARTISAPLRATLAMTAILVSIQAGPGEPGLASLVIEILLGSAAYLAAMWLMRRSWLPIFRTSKP